MAKRKSSRGGARDTKREGGGKTQPKEMAGSVPAIVDGTPERDEEGTRDSDTGALTQGIRDKAG